MLNQDVSSVLFLASIYRFSKSLKVSHLKCLNTQHTHILDGSVLDKGMYVYAKTFGPLSGPFVFYASEISAYLLDLVGQ